MLKRVKKDKMSRCPCCIPKTLACTHHSEEVKKDRMCENSKLAKDRAVFTLGLQSAVR